MTGLCQTADRLLLRGLFLVTCAIASTSCLAKGPKRGPVEVMVIATHPDDEVLLAGGLLAVSAREGRRVAVVLLTNGDYGCERDGLLREDETIAALTSLGVAERDVHFLGYPDGHLHELGSEPLAPVERRGLDGRCTRDNTTYARRGWRGTDEHTARTGAAARYTDEALVEDLAALLTRLTPTDVYLPHAIDEHPDHSATYAFFRRALERVEAAPRVHRGVVHAGDCWPAADCKTPLTLKAGIDPLPAPYVGFEFAERVPVDANLKLGAIEHFRSQLGATPNTSWLMSFARPEEVFFPEVLDKGPWGWERRPAPTGLATELELQLADGVPTVLRDSYAERDEAFELSVSNDTVELARVDEGQRTVMGHWRATGVEDGVLRVRIDPRPDDGALTEWTLYGEDGFVGEAVMPGLVRGVMTP